MARIPKKYQDELSNKYRKYNEFNKTEKNIIKSMGGYKKVKRMWLVNEYNLDKSLYNLFANGFTTTYTK